MSKNNKKIEKGLREMAIEDPADMENDDYEALDKELDQLNSALDKMENWSTSLHDKVADFLKEAQEQRNTTPSESTSTAKSDENATPSSENTTPSSENATPSSDKAKEDETDGSKKNEKGEKQ